MTSGILCLLDRERRVLNPRSSHAEIIVEGGTDGTDRFVAFCRVSEDCLDDLIHQQKARAERFGYSLEWKVYGHDDPPDLAQRLIAAGFEPDPVEQVVALKLGQHALEGFPSTTNAVIKRIEDAGGLEAVVEISRDIGRDNVERERARLKAAVEDDPESMSIYVAYVRGEPASCGRLHVGKASGLGELCGGRTKTKFRNQGLYLALVRARLVEAIQRELPYVTVDALPTSEPLLLKRGFKKVTWTQPFIYEP